MKINQLEPTPNPNAFKFQVDQLISLRPRSFANSEDSKEDILAQKLFGVNGVAEVFYLRDFITVTKTDDSDWREVMKEVGQCLLNIESSELPQVENADTELSVDVQDEAEKLLLEQVNVIFDEMVRPALANDGGGLELVAIQDKTLYIRYQGACGSCPHAITGTLRAIENLLQKHLDPEISVISA
jgi:Fe-S cluster biogenesis protein NfuA